MCHILFILADFGFARFLHDGNMAATLCGSPMYMVWKFKIKIKEIKSKEIFTYIILLYLVDNSKFFRHDLYDILLNQKLRIDKV